MHTFAELITYLRIHLRRQCFDQLRNEVISKSFTLLLHNAQRNQITRAIENLLDLFLRFVALELVTGLTNHVQADLANGVGIFGDILFLPNSLDAMLHRAARLCVPANCLMRQLFIIGRRRDAIIRLDENKEAKNKLADNPMTVHAIISFHFSYCTVCYVCGRLWNLISSTFSLIDFPFVPSRY